MGKCEFFLIPGTGRFYQGSLPTCVHAVEIAAHLVEVIVVGRVEAAPEKIEIIVPPIALGHEQQFAPRVASAQLL